MKRDLGKKIWIYTIMIIIIGLAALYSASYQNVRVHQSIFYNQLFCVTAGLIIMYLLGKVDYRKFYDGLFIEFKQAADYILIKMFYNFIIVNFS